MPSRRSQARRRASCRLSWVDKACWNESAGFGKTRRFFYAPSICFSSVSTIALLWLCFGAQLSAYFKRQGIGCNAAIAVIQTVPSKAHYRAGAAADGLRKHSLNVCIHWQQQALSSHDESSALGFAPFAIRFTASVSRLDDSAAPISTSFRVSGHNDAEHSAISPLNQSWAGCEPLRRRKIRSNAISGNAIRG